MDAENTASDEAVDATGFRLFTVPGLVDGAFAAWRQHLSLFVSLSLLSLGPLAALVMTLDYLSSVRRLFASTYEHDYILILAAIALPALLGWRAVCSGAMTRAALAVLQRSSLTEDVRSLDPVTVCAVFNEASQRGLRLLCVGLVRTLLVWVLPLTMVVFTYKVDPAMEPDLRLGLSIAVILVAWPIGALGSGLMAQWVPAAAAASPNGKAQKGVETLVRGVGLSFLISALTGLLILNLHLLMGLLLGLANSLFALDVSYWQQFFGLGNRLWLWSLFWGTALVVEPVSHCAFTFLWVDGRVRQDALDLRAALQRVKTRRRRTVLGRSQRRDPSLSGDRRTLTLLWAVTIAGVMAMGHGDLRAEDGQWEDLLAARQLMVEADGSWHEVARHAHECGARAVRPGEKKFWAQVEEAAGTANESWGRDKDRAVQRLHVILDGPRARQTPAAVRPAEVNGALEEVLAQPEFADLASSTLDRGRPDMGARGSLPDLGRRERASGACDSNRAGRALPKIPSGVDAEGVSFDGELFKVLAIALLVLAVILVLVAVLRNLTARSAPGGQTVVLPGQPMQAEDLKEEDALAYTREDWLHRARALVKSGDYRVAIRSLYLALLVSLHRARMLKYDASKTNWEYELELQGKARREGRGLESLRRFRDLASIFDLVWYGERQADRALFERCLEWAEAVRPEDGEVET